MAQFYTCIDGEMLDEICQAVYGYTRGAVEAVLSDEKNRDLAKKLPVLDAGDVVYLPDLQEERTLDSGSRLWS